MRPCVCPPGAELCFPYSCALWASPPTARPPGREAWYGLKTFTLVGGPLWCNYFPVCVLPTWCKWNLILLWLYPFYVCGFSFVFEYRISVLVSFNVFILFVSGDGGSPVSCDFGVFLIRCELTSFSSTISSQGPALFQNHIQCFHFSYIIYA